MQNKVYIIAEIGPNHNGNCDLALKMIEKIAKTGVNAIKFQLTDPYLLYSEDSFKVDYQKKNDDANSPREMSLKYQLKKEDHILLYEKCKECNVDYICTAFDLENLIFLDSNFEMPYFKIASGEIFSTDIINYMSCKNKPVILSTGMASFDEIEISINLINKESKKDITILHCISNYPTPAKDVNLKVMIELKKRFGYQIGFSDHTIGNDAAIAAVAIGASMVEKHVTMDKSQSGPDHKSSITIEELGQLVDSIRNVEIMMGSHYKVFSEDEIKIKQAVRKSMVATRKLYAGHIIEEKDICFKRPGTGILPIYKDQYIGKKLNSTVEVDRLIKKEYFNND